MKNDITEDLYDLVAFRVLHWVTNDPRMLTAAQTLGVPVTWYNRGQMMFMAEATGPQWERFSKGPAIRIEKQPHTGEERKVNEDMTTSDVKTTPRGFTSGSRPSRVRRRAGSDLGSSERARRIGVARVDGAIARRKGPQTVTDHFSLAGVRAQGDLSRTAAASSG